MNGFNNNMLNPISNQNVYMPNQFNYPNNFMNNGQNMLYNNQINNNIYFPNNNMNINMNFNMNNNNLLNNFNNLNLNNDNYNNNIYNNDINIHAPEIENGKYLIKDSDLECDKIITEKFNTSFEGIEKIYNQMRYCVCKKGFFCKVPYKNNYLPAFITSYGMIDENFLNKNNKIEISLDNDRIKKTIKLNKDKIIYMNKAFNITIIEIKNNEKFNDINYLKFDDELFTDYILENHLYIFDYRNHEDNSVSILYDSINKIVGYNLIISNNIYVEGMPILNLKNNNVIGIYTGGYYNKKKYFY